MIIVLDTNMILSALLFGGMVEKIIDLIMENKLIWYISPALSSEVVRKLHEFGASTTVIKKMDIVFEKGRMTNPQHTVTACRDSADNFILELAQECKADYIVTRDKDLLDLPSSLWEETKIIKPEAFLPLLRRLDVITR